MIFYYKDHSHFQRELRKKKQCNNVSTSQNDSVMVDNSDIVAHGRKGRFEQLSLYREPLESHLVDYSKPAGEQVEAVSMSSNQILKILQQCFKNNHTNYLKNQV